MALGKAPADIVFLNAKLFCPFDCKWDLCDFAVSDGIVIGKGDYSGREEIDLEGARVIPGLIDSHVHIESSLLTPSEYGRLVIPHGTTTVIADPHEIANVAGSAGIEYMLAEARKTELNIEYMVPSCVPATPADMGGALIGPEDIRRFSGRRHILGLGEMMNYPGVISGQDDVYEKLEIFDIIGGHCPGLTGKELNAYVMQGIGSEHECTNISGAREKLKAGMHIFMREGSTEKNLKALAPLIDEITVSRCSFATDDRHADMLYNSGHIDDCIRKAIDYGIRPELAYRMATLSASDRFHLYDRGAVSPGRRADFCIIDDSDKFEVRKTYVGGKEFTDPGHTPPGRIKYDFNLRVPEKSGMRIKGAGTAKVISIVEGEILTKRLDIKLDGDFVPDLENDILKAVVCDRYRGGGFGTGLVKGFGLKRGAIASSVSHDCHNVVAVGTSDEEIIEAIRCVASGRGGMAAACGERSAVLPFECGGIMSDLPYESVVDELARINELVEKMTSLKDPFMYLSFLALTVIPELRITDRGLFDVSSFSDVPVFD
ncbi:adenine deaminase [Methanolacinia petrolearia]|uniref:adenine deaminase n=1 Tax=Methanolacinia petrolearia TaxID=54120 RepID=UPI003BAC8567